MRAIAWLIVKLSGLFVKLYHLILNAIRRFDRAMRKRYRPKHLALMVVLVIAITASITLFVPPYLGLSNDGSFAAVLADTGLSRLDPSDTSAFFNYYERVYNVGSSALPTGTTPLVQRMLVRTAVVIERKLPVSAPAAASSRGKGKVEDPPAARGKAPARPEPKAASKLAPARPAAPAKKPR